MLWHHVLQDCLLTTAPFALALAASPSAPRSTLTATLLIELSSSIGISCTSRLNVSMTFARSSKSGKSSDEMSRGRS